VAVLSHRLWTAQFGADPSIVGKPVRLDGEPYTVIGVMPAHTSLHFLDPQIWRPLVFDALPARGSRSVRWAVARAREVAIHTALGAGRSRLVRQYVAEYLLIAIAGGGGGAFISLVTVESLRAAIPTTGYRAAFPAVLGDVFGMVAVGLALGVGSALVVMRLLRTFLYGVAPSDPLTMIAAAAVLATVTIVAGYVPARRTTRVDPVGALRS
jgi:predicted lysophospholipase L1 biosynthesis ABC-type transport system permease subunit